MPVPRAPFLPVACGLMAVMLAGPSLAAAPPHHVSDRGALELPGGRFARSGRDVRWGRAPDPARSAALHRLRAQTDGLWVAWDRDTHVPSRIVVSGIEAPGTVASAAEAEIVARRLLIRHLDLLAPGATPASFVLVSNHESAGIRSVGFEQRHHGAVVVGGQVSFRFKHDRLVALGSEALPDVTVPVRTTTVPRGDAIAAARTWIEHDVAGSITSVVGSDEVVVLPIVDAAGPRYKEVVAVEVTVAAPASRWTVYIDAESGDPVAREQTLRFASATVLYNVPDRGPLGTRSDRPAPLVTVLDQGEPLLTTSAGVLSFPAAPTVLEPRVHGPLVDVVTASGPVATEAFDVSDGAVIAWDESADETSDAQLSAFIHASVVKQYVRNVDPSLGWLDDTLPVTVNIEDECNAFSDGNSINFFLSSATCENTGRLADVVYHEFGHSVHTQSIIPGVGLFNTALSEGTSDYLSATITGDSGVARGFFFDDSPLRELDPDGFEWRWPEDRGEVHGEGRIIGGALWDLRKILVEKLGPAEGISHTDRIWYEATRRAVDIPSMYVEALLVDDNDGNIANGTPNGCEINAAFGPHGLFSIGEGGEERVHPIDQITPEGYPVRLDLAIPVFPGCPVSAAPELEWRVQQGPGMGSGLVPMTPVSGGFEAFVPQLEAGTVVEYQVRVNYSIGTERSLPDNYVDPWYEHFIGEVVPLYCTTFTDGADGWDLGNGWSVGPPSGQSAADPPTGFDGDGLVLGLALDGDGLYSPFSDTVASTPVIDTAGFDDVRLQYWRWLTVEDGFFDQARIEANGSSVWENHASPDEKEASFHHVDKEWRFQDIPLAAANEGQVQLSFTLQSDPGLHLGGWTLDQFCVVAFVDDASTCGNGILEASEECDDGNVEGGDGCTPQCTAEGDGPGPSDTGSPGSGSGGGTDTDGDTDGFDTAGAEDLGLVGRGCGCHSAPTERFGWTCALALLGLGATRRRRKG